MVSPLNTLVKIKNILNIAQKPGSNKAEGVEIKRWNHPLQAVSAHALWKVLHIFSLTAGDANHLS